MEKEKKIPELRFPEFKMQWEIEKLGNITEKMQSGVSRKLSDTDIGLPILRSNNLQDGELDISDIKYWYLKDNQGVNLKNYYLNENDILVNFINSVAQIGKTALFTNKLKRDTIFTTNILRLQIKEKFSTKFVFYNFNLNSYRNYIQSITKPAVNQASFTTKDFNNYKITFPSLPEQQKIADFLTAVDEKLAALKKKKALLEQYKKGVMQKIFSQEIRYKPALSAVEGDENGNAFPEWERKKLGDFLIQAVREVPKPTTNYLAIGIRSHCRGTFQKPNSEPDKIAMDKLYVVKAGDLIVNITFAWESAIAIVKPEDDGGLVSHRFPTYKFNENVVIGAFFQYVFIQKKFRHLLGLISPGGAGRNRVLNKTDFLKLKWSIPSIEEQTKIANFLYAIDKKIEQVTTQIETTANWKKGLLQKMFV